MLSLSSVRVKGGESEYFRIDSGVRQGFTMSLWLFHVYMNALIKKMLQMGVRRRGENGDCLASCMQMT